MKTKITVMYPVSLETVEVKNEMQKYGQVTHSPANFDTKELNTSLSKTDLADLESFLVENEVPYDLMHYSTGIEAPTMKKVRPELDFSKEISATFYQNEEEEIEEGVVAVTTLLTLISQADASNPLAQTLLAEIKKSTFKFDEIEDIFEM